MNSTGTEHVIHVSNTADIPSGDIPVKGCLIEHGIHVSNTADIPLANIIFKGCHIIK